MSLRDGLLKAGLASKKQAKVVEKEAKRNRHQKLKAQKKKRSTIDQDADSDYQKLLEEKKTKDRELNAERERMRSEKERLARAKAIAHSRNQLEPFAPICYYFAVKSKVKKINVSVEQQSLLASGALGIVCDRPFDSNEGIEFFLLKLEDLRRMQEIDPSMVICHHDNPP
jgi:uncharacterized protein